MTQHTDLIDRLRSAAWAGPVPCPVCDEAANALEAAAKNPFEAMPHDIPQRMKDTICEETGWSGSMVSRMYAELRKAFTGEPYKANEDLDAALLEIERMRKDAMRWQNQYNELRHLVDRRPAINAGLVEAYMRWNTECYLLDFHNADDDAADAAMSQKGQP